ncbi:MAG TPA: shikimate kinase [Tepidiformaceae bacterium]|nr:shikimate kinase [Tepidiformaceae bacterium]
MRAVPVGSRVVVYGPSGSGKSTVAEALAAKLGLPWVELDAIFHARPQWQDLARDEFRALIPGLLAEHAAGWVMDGNYGMVRDLILPEADTVILLELPFATVYRRLATRTVGRSVRGTELWNGNRETLRQTFLTRHSMLVWGLRASFDQRRLHGAVREEAHTARVYRLRTVGQVRYLLQNACESPRDLPG